jgi:hypothetical protein
MSERFPDIEVYILKAEPADIQAWLTSVFKHVEEQKQNTKSVQWLVDDVQVLYTANSNKNFASLWFKENKTPWNNDLECGRALHAALGNEVRCSKAAWQEGDEGPAWTKLIRGDEKDLDWD